MRLPIPALPLAAAVAALVLTGCSGGDPDPATPTASSSSSASGAPSASTPATSDPAPSATSTALSTPEAQASALVQGLGSAGALSDEQRQAVQDRLTTALADPSTQDQLQQVCTVLGSGLVSDATVRSLVRKQLDSSGTSLSDAQVDAVIDTLRNDVCTS